MWFAMASFLMHKYYRSGNTAIKKGHIQTIRKIIVSRRSSVTEKWPRPNFQSVQPSGELPRSNVVVHNLLISVEFRVLLIDYVLDLIFLLDTCPTEALQICIWNS